MNTFQTVVNAIIHGITRFLPVSTSTHEYLLVQWLRWPTPSDALTGALGLGALLALLIHFRHDWASMLSSFLQVLIFRKKPMTLDERLPFFLAITTVPVGVLSYYLILHSSRGPESEPGTLVVGLVTGALAIPLWMSERWSKKNRGMFDWNIVDAVVIGITQCAALLPGGDPLVGSLTGAFFRNYSREAATKYSLFALFPLLAAVSWHSLRAVDFHSPQPAPDTSWLSIGVGFVASLFFGMIVIGGVTRQSQRRGFAAYAGYRILLAAALIALFWFKERS